MKYLIFNFAVFLALGYLIMGDQMPGDLSEKMEKAGARIEQIVREKPTKETPKRPPEIKRIVEALPENEALKPDPVMTAEPELPPLEAPIEIKKVVAQKAPPAQVEPQVEAQVEPALSPPKAQQPGLEVAQSDPPETGETSAPEQRLIETKSRAQALREMAAEMEQMFAEKMTW